MCRFTLYLGPTLPLEDLLTTPEHSILVQSRRSRERREPMNGDGFGVAWYVPHRSPEPALFRSLRPAWSDPNLIDLARVSESGCILAHVRAATGGTPVGTANCHPFRSGQLTFMHNGEVGGFSRIRRPLLDSLSDEAFGAIGGTTDSEHAFAVLIDELARDNDLGAALRRTIHRLLELVHKYDEPGHSYLNFAVADGERAAVSRFTTESGQPGESLYLHDGRKYVCEDGVGRMVDAESGQGSVIVSSEALSAEPGWDAVPRNSLVVVERGREATVEPI